MAETPTNDNWIGSWFSTAKTKSAQVLEFMKKDLEEFGAAVKNEATNVVTSTGNVIEKTLNLDSPTSTVNSMKRNFNSLIEQMNNVLSPISPDDSETEAILIIGDGSETVTLSKLEQAIYNLQKDDSTFTTDPEEYLKQQFECWLEVAIDNDQLNSDRITRHIESSTMLQNQYKKLVPDVVTYSLFWRRYLFKKALLEDDIAKEEAKTQRKSEPKLDSNEPSNWEQDLGVGVDLTEEEQIKLLEDYESEIRQSKPAVAKSASVKSSENTTTMKTNVVDEKCINKEGSSSSSTDGEWEKVAM